MFVFFITHAPCLAEDIELLPELTSIHLCKLREIELEQLKKHEQDKVQEISDIAEQIAAALQSDTLSSDFAAIAKKCTPNLGGGGTNGWGNENCTKELFLELLKNREGLLEEDSEVLPAKYQELRAIVAKKEAVAKNIKDFKFKRSLELPFDHGQT
jgi:hypothetical protein